MEELLTSGLALLAAHGYIIIFVWMFADQAALPIPSIPLLIAVGALTASGELELLPTIATATAATLLADSLWYTLGRLGGARAISLVCKLSIEPDSCVSSTRTAFGKFGPATLLIAKFLPGVQTLAPASTGFVRAPVLGFLALDLCGTLLFLLPFILGGHYFQPQLVTLLESLGQYSGGLTMAVLAILGIYASVKLVHWILFFREHRLRRMSVDELFERTSKGTETTIIDLRQRLDFELQPAAIPGSLRIPINEIRKRRDEIPLHHDVVLVCT